MNKRVFVLGLLAFTGACGADGGELARLKVPGYPGTFVIEDAARTTPLTAVEHLLFYEAGGERVLLFHGYGGQAIELSRLGPNTLLVSYCKGSVTELKSSFLLDPSKVDDLHLMRLQVVTEPGLSAGGRQIC